MLQRCVYITVITQLTEKRFAWSSSFPSQDIDPKFGCNLETYYVFISIIIWYPARVNSNSKRRFKKSCVNYRHVSTYSILAFEIPCNYLHHRSKICLAISCNTLSEIDSQDNRDFKNMKIFITAVFVSSRFEWDQYSFTTDSLNTLELLQSFLNLYLFFYK